MRTAILVKSSVRSNSSDIVPTQSEEGSSPVIHHRPSVHGVLIVGGIELSQFDSVMPSPLLYASWAGALE